MVWYLIGVYIVNRTLHGRLEIRNFSSDVEEDFTRSLCSLGKYFSTLQKKFRISARPCNILYIFMGSVYSKMATNFMVYFFMVIGPQCLVSA